MQNRESIEFLLGTSLHYVAKIKINKTCRHPGCVEFCLPNPFIIKKMYGRSVVTLPGADIDKNKWYAFPSFDILND